MKMLRVLAVAGVLALTGCAGSKTTAPSEAAAMGGEKPAPIITPDGSLAGRISRVNESARFVVIEFPVGRMARVDQVLAVYHEGLKAGEVKVTGPQQDVRIVADLISGTAQTGDEVREQ